MDKKLDIPISFAGKDLASFATFKNPDGKLYYQAIISLKVIWAERGLQAEVRWNNELLYPPPCTSPSITTSDSSVMSGSDSMEPRVTLVL